MRHLLCCSADWEQVQRAFGLWGCAVCMDEEVSLSSFFSFNSIHFCFHSEVLWGFALPPRQGLNVQFALGCSSRGCCTWLLMSSLEIRVRRCSHCF